MKCTEIREIPLEKFISHPDNPNWMNKETFAKLLANIKKTGLYEPVVVRQVGDKYQIINGHNRIDALKILGAATAMAVVWELDDATALTMLASLNRLNGTDVPENKSRLYAQLLAKFSAKDLAKLLPCRAEQIEKLASMKLPDIPAPAVVMPETMVFFLNKQQRATVEAALAKALKNDKCLEGRKLTSTAQRNAEALTYLAETYAFPEKAVSRLLSASCVVYEMTEEDEARARKALGFENMTEEEIQEIVANGHIVPERLQSKVVKKVKKERKLEM